MRTQRTKVQVLASLDAIRRRTQQALEKVDPTAAQLLAAGADENVKLLEAGRFIAELFIQEPFTLIGYDSDSRAQVTADALSTVLGRPFHVFAFADETFGIGQGAR